MKKPKNLTRWLVIALIFEAFMILFILDIAVVGFKEADHYREKVIRALPNCPDLTDNIGKN